MCFVRGLAWLYKFYFNSFCERFTLFDYLLTTVRTAWPGWANTHSEYSLVPYSIKHFLRCLRKKKNIDKRTQLKGKRKLSVLKCNRKAPCERICNKYNKLLSTFLFIYLDSPTAWHKLIRTLHIPLYPREIDHTTRVSVLYSFRTAVWVLLRLLPLLK